MQLDLRYPIGLLLVIFGAILVIQGAVEWNRRAVATSTE